MKPMNKLFAALAGLVVTAAPLTAHAFEAPAGSTTITIVHTNDMHGRLVGTESIIGLDTVAAIYAATDNAILVDAGDTFHGLPFVTFNQGINAVELMNQAGYSLFVPGNHDFNYGADWLLMLEDYAEFDFIAANLLREADNSSVFEPVALREIAGVQVGFFGLAYPGTPTVTNPVNVVGLNFTNPVEAARESVATLHDMGAEVIVAMAHLGVDGMAWGREIAAQVPEIHVVIDGHSHTLLEEGYWVEDVLVAQAGAHGQFVGMVDITLYNGQVIHREARVIDKAASLDFDTNTALYNTIAEMTAELDEVLDEVVGYMPVTLLGDSPEHRTTLRSSEVAIGNLINDAILWATGADIAVTNSGGIRYHLHAGDITKGDIIQVLAFFNFAVVLEITPATLFEALENGVSAMPGNGRFPQIAGFSFVFDESLPEGERVLAVTFNGEDLDPTDTTTLLTMATNNFMSVGGDNYTMFLDLATVAEFDTQDAILIAYLQAHETINADLQGRIINVSHNPTIPNQNLAPQVEAIDNLPETDIDALESELLVTTTDDLAIEATVAEPTVEESVVAESVVATPYTPAVQPIAPMGIQLGQVTDAYFLNIRAAGHPDANIIGVFARGDQVTILDTNSWNWHQVQLDQGTGWIYGGFVSIQP